MYNIRLGIPEMEQFWKDLCKKVKTGKANKNDKTLHKKLGKTMVLAPPLRVGHRQEGPNTAKGSLAQSG